jgi:glycosyltransferase involved in cell wall biosynthesis
VRIHVVVPVFNRPDLLLRCLGSLVEQEDEDFSVTIADDASTDPEMGHVLDSVAFVDDFMALRQGVNLGATRNIVEAIRRIDMAPTDVVLLVDGDDRLAHPGVLARIRQAYAGDVEMTYGSYVPEPFEAGCYPARPIPLDVLATGTVRAFHAANGQWFNHPLSFRRRAFDAVDEADYHWDLDLEADWLHYGYDVTMGLPLLEAVGRRAEWISDFLYVYTSDRPEAVWREHGEAASAEGAEVFGRRRRYWPYDT